MSKKKKTPVGRPPVSDPLKQFPFRAGLAQRNRWAKTARQSGDTIGGWIRKTLDAASKGK